MGLNSLPKVEINELMNEKRRN